MFTKSTLTLILVVAVAGPAMALSIHPTPHSDLSDLDHSLYYTWGIKLGMPQGMQIETASLFIDDIYDWTAERTDILYVHLLDNPPANPLIEPGNLPSSRVTTNWDNENHGDAFEGQGVRLFTYTDRVGGLPSEDLNYTFTASDIKTLNDYWANNGVFGLGFDPDCHYYNKGITFNYTLVPVPEPTTLVLLAMGLGAAAFRRRFHA
jgi:hypothetical protein